MSPGERTDVARLSAALLDALQDHFGDPDVAYSAAPQRLGGGKFSQVFAFMLCRNGEVPRSYVLRLLGSASDQACLEAGLHAAAQAEHFGAPRVVLWEPADSRLGQAYLVMERVPGHTYLRGVEPLRFALDLPKLLAV